ncbi:hypothetical protein Taro_050345 [Colocasia esculenta]|uniref:Uncharacterized protein n=1 Tax=Colocasia esculenta TaxID=4460 RepID=A0A843XD64_COLES|nr:hypothetical protein [Colocasia esculenta]
MLKPQLFFPSYNRTPKHHGCLNTLQQTLGDEFTSCWGRVEKFLAAGEQEIVHTKAFFSPFSSTATCTNRPLEVDQRTTLHQNRESLVPNPKHCPFSVGFRRRPCERDDPIGRVLRSCRDSKPVAF